MNRSMVLSVGVLVVVGIIVVYNIVNEDQQRDRPELTTGGSPGMSAGAGTVPGHEAAAPGAAPGPAKSTPPAAPDTTPPAATAGDEEKGAVARPTTVVDPAWKKALESCAKRIELGEVGPTLRELGHRYRTSTKAGARAYWRGPLIRWAAAFLYTPSDKSGMYDRYVMKSGDVLVRVAARPRREKKVLVCATFIQDVNRIADPTRIQAGQVLWLPNVSPSAVVTLSEYRLDFFLGDCLFTSFACGVGADNKTPAVTFEVGDKLEKPDWFYGGKVIPYGDPGNELGERWIGVVHASHQRYGIHGTNDETTIGKAVSRGCIRLRNQDVVKLYRWLPKGATVDVRP